MINRPGFNMTFVAVEGRHDYRPGFNMTFVAVEGRHD